MARARFRASWGLFSSSFFLGFPVGHSFDNANRVVQLSRGGATVSLGYDNRNRPKLPTPPNGIVMGSRRVYPELREGHFLWTHGVHVPEWEHCWPETLSDLS